MQGFFNFDEICLNVSTSQSGVGGKGYTYTWNEKDIYTGLIGQKGIPSRIDTTYPIGLVFFG